MNKIISWIKNNKRLTFLLVAILGLLSIGKPASAQMAQEAEMADIMRQSGKIYVVVAVLLVLFLGIVIYLFSIDRKVSRLEKQVNEK